jgi:hypothetical protein
VSVLGENRFAVRARGQEQLVTGLEEAERARADALAERRRWQKPSTSPFATVIGRR